MNAKTKSVKIAIAANMRIVDPVNSYPKKIMAIDMNPEMTSKNLLVLESLST